MVLLLVGVCTEASWPSTDGVSWTHEPSDAAKAEATQHKAKRAYALSSADWIKACLTLGFPVIFGVALPNSFDDIGADGKMELPAPGEDDSERGHCMLMVGYESRNGVDWFKVKNSWGADWGDGGYCWMPRSFIDQGIADEFWSIHEAAA
jgi:C1A family cysteine protease